MAKKNPGSKKSGGSMMSMRSGFQGITGGGKKRKRGRRKEPDFFTVLGWVGIVALIGLLIWGIR